MAVAAGLFVVLPAEGAWANTNVAINPGNVPTTAGDAPNLCEANFGGGPLPGQDVWVFVLPDLGRDFVSITANFDSDGNGTADASRTAPADGGIADDNGTSKGWVLAPAGWTLISATAVVTGSADPNGVSFNLTHACPASGSPSPSPSRSPSASPSHTPTPQPSVSITPLGNPGSPSATTSPSSEQSVPPPASETPGDRRWRQLPVSQRAASRGWLPAGRGSGHRVAGLGSTPA
jgi:hypothetical protein